jgi:hypothetical protein
MNLKTFGVRLHAVGPDTSKFESPFGGYAVDASEFPSSNTEGMRGIVTAQIEANRARVVVVRNSRIYIGTLFLLSLASAFIAVCSILAAISQLFPLSALTIGRGLGAAQWGFGGLLFASTCPFLWKTAKKMAHPSVRFDRSDVQFNLGTRKAPIQLSMPWDKITAILQQRVGNAQQFTVQASDGSYVQFSSYTFLRPKKVARLIAERTGHRTIQKS